MKLNNFLFEAKPKTRGCHTDERTSMDSYYTKQSNYRENYYIIIVKPDLHYTLVMNQIFKCREENPNIDGKGYFV